MKISARVDNSDSQHKIELTTSDNTHAIEIAPKSTGFGSSANGGELLFLALATCYCNDIYREATQRGINVERVEVQVSGDFDAVGAPAKNVEYRAKVHAKASEEQIRELMKHTDRVAEVQNTLRVQTPVVLSGIDVVSL